MRTQIKRKSLNGTDCGCLNGSRLGNIVTDTINQILPKTSTGQTGIVVEVKIDMSSVILLTSGVFLAGVLIKHL